jgi:hypothetical protein
MLEPPQALNTLKVKILKIGQSAGNQINLNFFINTFFIIL